MEKQKTNPKDFFLTATAVVALYASLVSLITLLFEYIERLVGDPFSNGYYDPYASGIRFALSTLIVIFPVFLYFTRILNKDIRENPEKKELWVRKWLLVLTVFLAGLTMIVDLIVLLNTFLGGEELTFAFLLKVITIFAIAGGVLWYYLKDIRGYWEAHEALSVRIGQGVALFVTIAVVGGFFIMGSPYEQRALRYDSERISNLESLQYSITDYYRNKQALPETLDDMNDPLSSAHIPTDPRTGETYTYTKKDALTFELCATFDRASLKKEAPSIGRDTYIQPEFSEHWEHGADTTCFERTVDPEKYKPY